MKNKKQRHAPDIEALLQYANGIIATLREPFLVLDKSLQVISANQAFYTTFKVTEIETIGRLLPDLGNRQWNIPKLLQLLKEIIPEKKVVKDYEVEHKFEQIGNRAMILNASQLRVPKKIATIIAAIPRKEELILLAIEDITERRDIEDGLEKARKELEATKISEDAAREYAESIINTVREPLIALDQDLRVVSVSRSFYEVFKVKPEETVGQLIYDLGNKQWDIPKLRELLETILPQKATFDNYEVEHDFASIGRRIMLLNARQIQRVLGKERVILLAIEDITERKRVEDELANAYAGLEDKVRQRTKELREAQDRIVRSEKLAAIGQLASSVAHELRNPLGVIKNAIYYLNMLELGKDNPDIKENLEIISVEIENSDKVISDLLEFSRIKKPALNPEEINLIIKETLNRVKAPANIKVVAELGENLPQIQVDALQLQQVFYNLASNAIQAMEKVGTLTVSSYVTHDETIAIAFIDTGCGIPKENLQKIFEPLFSTNAKGTGLGLSVVASLVESHGGKIEIESEAGKGSTFTVKLPIKRG